MKFEKMLCAVSVFFMLWMAIGYAEILIKNTSPNPEYSKANIVVKMIELGGK